MKKCQNIIDKSTLISFIFFLNLIMNKHKSLIDEISIFYYFLNLIINISKMPKPYFTPMAYQYIIHLMNL